MRRIDEFLFIKCIFLFTIIKVILFNIIFAESCVWEELEPLPVGLAGFSIGVKNDQVYIAGGTTWIDDQKFWSDKILSLDLDDGVWKEAGNLPFPLAYSGFINTEVGLILFGGQGPDSSYSDIILFDSIKNQKRLPGLLSHAWKFAHGGRIGNNGYFIVRRELKNGIWEGAFLKVNLKNFEVEFLPGLPNQAWILPAVVVVGNKIIVAGGARRRSAESIIENQKDIYVFDVLKNEWINSGALPIPARGMAGCSLNASRIYLAGGYTDRNGGKFLSDGYIYNVSTGEVMSGESLPFGSMPGMVKSEYKVILFVGEDAHKSRSRKIFKTLISKLTQTK